MYRSLRPLVRPHVAPNDAWVIVVFLAVVVVLLSSCAAPAAERGAPTSVTSGKVAAAQTSPNDQLASARISELETERDRALLKASDAQSLAATTRERSEKALKALAVRNDFEDAMWSKLERLDARMKSVRFDASHLGADVRFKVHHQLEALADRRNAVEKEMHRIHSIPIADFDAYAKEVELSLNSVARDVESIELKP